jgi:hypothetical protein
MSIQHETKEGLPRRHRARFPSAFLDKQHIKKNEANIYNQSVETESATVNILLTTVENLDNTKIYAMKLS